MPSACSVSVRTPADIAAITFCAGSLAASPSSSASNSAEVRRLPSKSTEERRVPSVDVLRLRLARAKGMTRIEAALPKELRRGASSSLWPPTVCLSQLPVTSSTPAASNSAVQSKATFEL